MNIKKLKLPGCFEITPDLKKDKRGKFVKTFNTDIYSKLGIELDIKEEYFSTSNKNVLRGFHFQVPPYAGAKLVYCMEGKVVDVLLDIRKGSPTFGKTTSLILDSNKFNIVFIAPGIAHCFYVVGKSATLVYKTDKVYSPKHDKGIKWDSVRFKWPKRSFRTSKRDSEFPVLSRFKTPFRYKK
jgi:dTDP-4-dehydrorhamnose 3,5-epimerase